MDNSSVVKSNHAPLALPTHEKKPCNIKYRALHFQCNFYLESEQISVQPELLFVLDKYIGL